MSPASRNNTFFLKVLLHAGFFVSGISTIIIGQVLPILASRFSLDDAMTGNFFPAQFGGSLCGTFLTNRLGKNGRFLLATIIGCCFMAVGVLSLNLGSYELCLLGFVLNGVGVGLTLPAINMLIVELNPERPAPALSVLNFFWGLGAIVCSLAVLPLARIIGYFPVSLMVAVPLLIVAAFVLTMPSDIEKQPMADETNADDYSVAIWTRPIAWMIAGFNFIHVGFESAIGGWLPTYAERLQTDGFVWWLAPTFLYFVFFVVGRGVAPLFFRFLNENQMLMFGLLTILGGMIIILSASNVMMLGLGAAVAGFGTSWVFPTNMSRFTKTFGPSASRRAMPFFLCGTIGSIFSTWFIGWLSHRFDNDLRSGMFLLLGSIIVLIVIQTALMLKSRTA